MVGGPATALGRTGRVDAASFGRRGGRARAARADDLAKTQRRQSNIFSGAWCFNAAGLVRGCWRRSVRLARPSTASWFGARTPLKQDANRSPTARSHRV